jgi:ubiquinone/menaquinone biosynthesis C-methylase UbiE/catechol 2,3-dioxygenase-like lactoylglutathione lyase family enzyme
MLRLKRLDHVQMCIPVGEEENARTFYGETLGLAEIPKPESLIDNGGLWFQAGDVQLHIGVEALSSEKSKQHPAFEVENIAEARQTLEVKGIKIQEEKPIPHVARFSFVDPFGNRIEFLERVKAKDTSVKQAVRTQFGRSAEAYVLSKVHAKGEDLSKLVEISGIRPTDVVLDIATGGGHVANALAPLAEQITALDLTTEILDVARRFISGNGYSHVDFVQGDAERLPFADNRFDIVTSRIAPHHFPNLLAFIQESFRVLKPGGRFLLADNVVPEEDEKDVFYNEVEKRRDYSHHRAWKKSEWIRMLEEHCFEIEEWYRFTKVFEFEDWCRRMHLSDREKQALSNFMIDAPQEIHNHFRIQIKEQRVISFQGESILLKASKPLTQ